MTKDSASVETIIFFQLKPCLLSFLSTSEERKVFTALNGGRKACEDLKQGVSLFSIR
jgi:hypothetical protein